MCGGPRVRRHCCVGGDDPGRTCHQQGVSGGCEERCTAVHSTTYTEVAGVQLRECLQPKSMLSCRNQVASLVSVVSPLSILTPPLEQTRAELGFPPLVIVVIGLIYSRRRAAKLSSTDLREEDAAGL